MLVSVIVPSFNRKGFLEEAVASVFSQSFQDFELIIVDDGSAPGHLPKIENQRLKVFRLPHRGVAAARNFGVAMAVGKYLAFLDSDDLWVKNKLEKQLSFMLDNPLFKICHTHEKWQRNGQHLNQMKKHQKYGGWIFDKCLPLCLISCSSVLMERELFETVGGFDEGLPVCEDYDLWLRIAHQHPIGFIDEPLIIKRGGHPDQLSKKYWGMDRFRVRALEKLLRLKLKTGQRNLVLTELKKKYAILAAGAWKRRKFIPWLYYQIKGLSHGREG